MFDLVFETDIKRECLSGLHTVVVVDAGVCRITTPRSRAGGTGCSSIFFSFHRRPLFDTTDVYGCGWYTPRLICHCKVFCLLQGSTIVFEAVCRLYPALYSVEITGSSFSIAWPSRLWSLLICHSPAPSDLHLHSLLHRL